MTPSSAALWSTDVSPSKLVLFHFLSCYIGSFLHWYWSPVIWWLCVRLPAYQTAQSALARPRLFPDRLHVHKGSQQPLSLPGDQVKLQGYTSALSRVTFTLTVGMRDLKHQVMFGTIALECLFCFNEFILLSYFWGKKKPFFFMLVFVLLLRCDQSQSWLYNHIMHFGCSSSPLWNVSLFSCLWQPNFTSR